MDNPSTGWQEISDWNSSNWALWRPDANETYAVVCMVSCNGDEKVDSQVVWYVSRPQMGKRILGNCATPTNDGLLYGCTSNVTSQDSDYWTSCYIYSFELQGWIAIGSSNAYGASWFKVSSLPSGTYMMY